MRQLANGKWLVEFRKGRDPERPNSRSRTFDTKEEAERYQASLPDRRKKRRVSGCTFGELAEEYTLSKMAGMSESDQDNNYWKLNGIILPRLGHLAAAGVTQGKLDQYVAGRLRDHVYVYRGKNLPRKKTDRQVSLATIRRELEIVRAILNWGVRRQYLTSSPMAGYDMPRKQRRSIIAPTDEEFEKILEHASPHCRRFALLAYYTGLRPGKVEAFGLKWDMVDLDAPSIQITSAEKGGVAYRTVKINARLLAEMKKWKKEDEDAGYKNGYIIHYKFKPIASIKKAWASAKRRAGITRKLEPYSLRRRTATKLLEKSGDIQGAADILGNTPEVLMKHYRMVKDARRDQLIDDLD